MVVNVYSVFDEKAKSFAPPFCMHTDGQATRGFGDACEDPKSLMSKHPQDYSLYKLGSFDDFEGKMIPLNQPELLNRASEFVS